MILYHLPLSLRIFRVNICLLPHGILNFFSIIAFKFCKNKNVHELLKYVHENDSQ